MRSLIMCFTLIGLCVGCSVSRPANWTTQRCHSNADCSAHEACSSNLERNERYVGYCLMP